MKFAAFLIAMVSVVYVFHKSEMEDRYESVLGQVVVPEFVPDSVENCTVQVGENFSMSVIDAMEQKSTNWFVMLNGENVGVYVNIASEDCFKFGLMEAVKVLRDGKEVDNDIRVLNQMGKVGYYEMEDRIVHVLLDSQIWIWPGIQVGHEYDVDGIRLTTMSLRPLVYTVDHFATEEDAQYILEEGLKNMSKAYLNFSTNDEYWFKDDAYTRAFRKRFADLARLSSASFPELFRLNRYRPGQFNGLHTDYIHTSNELENNLFLPKGYHERNYLAWATWAKGKIDELAMHDIELLPMAYRPNGTLYVDPNDTYYFQHHLLRLYLQDYAERPHAFPDYTPRMADLVQLYLDSNYGEIIEHMLRLMPDFYLDLVRVWEAHIGLPQLHFTYVIYILICKNQYISSPPEPSPLGISHYFRWIRWCKEQIAKHHNELPSSVQPGGRHYPSYAKPFQNYIVDLVMDQYSRTELIAHGINHPGIQWIRQEQHKRNILFLILKNFPVFFDLIPVSWERTSNTTLITYPKPSSIVHFYPQRFVTLVLSLNNVQSGGETVFPYSNQRPHSTNYVSTMKGCSKGLAIPPRYLRSILFYSQTPDGKEDPISRHGGCPPIEGIKCTFG